MIHAKRVVAVCLIVLMALQATGCHSWRAVPQPVPAAVAQYPNRKVQVVYQGGGIITADSAKAEANTLVAYLRLGVDTIPLAEVKEVKVLRFNPLKVFGLVVGTFAAFLAVVVIVCVAQDCMAS